MIVGMELKQFFTHPRSLHAVPITLAGVFLVLWPYFPSPFVLVVVALFAAVESQFNNILFRTRNELESLSVLPTHWEKIVKAKNIATMLLVAMMFPVVAATILYFSPSTVPLKEGWASVLYISSVIFPVLHVGNLRSVQHPRRITGWQLDDAAGIVEILMVLAVFSIPFLLFVVAIQAPLLCLAYSSVTAVFWWRRSIPKAAALIASRNTELCLTTRTSSKSRI
jgi:uncharacterized membrane protein YbaN (DUF454 family)